MNDAELVRAKALGVLAELSALGVPGYDVAILVSLGTSAVTAGFTLAGALARAELQYAPQSAAAHGELFGVSGPVPVRIPTEAAWRAFEAAALERPADL